MVTRNGRKVRPVIGILALQGDVQKHRDKLAALGADVQDVRTAEDVERLSGLIIPGGESTTMTKLMMPELREALLQFSRTRPMWGTCAGMIMLAQDIGDPRVSTLALMDLNVDRNGFGRQVHSFEAKLRVAEEVGLPDTPLPGVFIRAPRVKSFLPSVRPLVWLEDEPVCWRQGNLLASSFHPELTDDDRLHQYFLAMSA
jgi:5'-phosphate synthase pdxT subunit